MALSKVAKGAVGVVLLLCSNIFMNTAWYLHLKYHNWSMAQAIFTGWATALPEYSLQVPGNRIAHISHGGPFTAPQLKVIQEALSLITFAVFSTVVLKEKLRWADLGAFVLIMSGVLLALLTKSPATTTAAAQDKPAIEGIPPPPLDLPADGRALIELPTGLKTTTTIEVDTSPELEPPIEVIVSASIEVPEMPHPHSA